jgi:hypothetical protein
MENDNQFDFDLYPVHFSHRQPHSVQRVVHALAGPKAVRQAKSSELGH